MQDPVMLAFDELRNWFFDVLSAKECKKDVIEEISSRQSYIKHFIHTDPDYGPESIALARIGKELG